VVLDGQRALLAQGLNLHRNIRADGFEARMISLHEHL
jgi:hypothetical protein